MLLFGASREQQLDDFYLVTLDRATFKITDVKEVEIKEREGLTTRNSMGAVAYKGRVVLFAGQDSENGVLYNDLFTIDSTFKV